MGFNFGGFATGAMNGATEALKISQAFKQAKNQDDLQDAMKNMPEVGSDNVGAGPTGYKAQDGTTYAPGALDATAKRQGVADPQFSKFTQADQDSYVQKALLRTGNVDMAAKYNLQRQQGGYYQSEAGKNNQATDIVGDFRSKAADIQKSYGAISTKLASGDIPGVQKDIIDWGKQHGVTPVVSPDGKTWTVDGKAYDATNPTNLQSALSALQNHAYMNLVSASSPTNAVQASNANSTATTASAAATNAASEAALVGPRTTLMGAQSNQANAEASLAPARAQQLRGSANASNAEASIAPSRIVVNQAQAGNLDAEANLHDSQSTGIGYSNDAKAAIAALPPTDFKPGADGTSPADAQLRQASALEDPTRTYGTDVGYQGRTYAADARADAQTQSAQIRADAQTKALVAKQGGQAADWNMIMPNQYINKKTGQVISVDPKTNEQKVTQLGATASGVQRTVKLVNGEATPLFVGAQGKLFFSEPEALQSMGRGSVTPKNSPLPPKGPVTAQALPGPTKNPF